MINITDEELNDSIQQLQMLLYKVSDVEDISVYAPVLKKLIAEHEATRGMEWVSVDEQMPPIGVLVDVCIKFSEDDYGRVTDCEFTTKYGWGKDGESLHSYLAFVFIGVTHWRPILPLPTGESE